MSCKYKYGDKVEVNGHAGKVTSIYQKPGVNGYICTVTFDRENIIPSEMDFKEDLLKRIGEEINSNELKCTCGTTAAYGHIVVEHHSDYCDLKGSEKRVMKKEWKPKINKNFSNTKLPGIYTNSVLDQLDDMYGDEDDDFGFYGV